MFDNENNEQQSNKETGFGRETDTNYGSDRNNSVNSSNDYGVNTQNNTYGHNTYGQNTYNQNTYNQNSTYGNYTSSSNGSHYQQNGNYNYNNQGTYGNYQYSYQPGMNGGNGPKKSGTGKKVAAAIAIAVILCIALGAGYYSMTRIAQIPATEKSAEAELPDKAEDAQETPAASDSENAVAADDSSAPAVTAENAGIDQTETVEGSKAVVTDVTQVVAAAMPAMVSINNNFTQAYNYFGQTYSQEQTASGSGFIVGTNDTELLIATNYHVIEGADSLEVQFVDDSKSRAEVKGTDSNMDLAVIAVQLSDLTTDTRNAIAIATLGDSDALTLGEPAIAIGNALGYGQSVTTGVISAVNRVIDLSEAQDGSKEGTFIQTNAEINPGNSGGALLNIKGEVVGINSNKIGGSTVEGMGYAIPISKARPIIEQLMTEKTRAKVEEAKRGFLGISGVSVTTDVSQMYGLPLGVYVASVSEEGGAKAAGVQEGDIITKFDGKEISSMDDLQNRLAYYEAGESVSITVQRQASGGYQDQEIQVTLGAKQTVQSDSDTTDGQKYEGERQPDAKQEEGQQGIDPFSDPFGFGFDFGN